MTALSGVCVGKDLCEAVGLDPSKVRRIRIDATVGEATIIEVWEYLQDDELDRLKLMLTKYTLDKV